MLKNIKKHTQEPICWKLENRNARPITNDNDNLSLFKIVQKKKNALNNELGFAIKRNLNKTLTKKTNTTIYIYIYIYIINKQKKNVLTHPDFNDEFRGVNQY